LDYIIIIEYANKGNLRKCLAEITNWKQKLFMLYQIIYGLNSIHKDNLIHFDFHDGNILCNKNYESIYGAFISDYLESYQLAKSFSTEDNIYGVLPFMAPEVLRSKPYTQASNIYSFSMIMWEFTSGVPPFNNRAHDIQLALSICKGERPEIIENTPQCYIDLMKKCWDDNPLKRPSASEILDIIKKWRFLPSGMNIENISKELNNIIMEFINKPTGHNNLITEPHLQAYYTSHLLGFTSKELLNESKFFELKQKQKDTEQKLLKLETNFQSLYQNIQMELFNLQQRNFQFEQDNQKLRLDLAIQIKEFAEKENKEQAKLTNEQVQIQISQLKQEKINLQEKLTQIEDNIQKFKSQQESLIEQKEQLENKLIQSQVNYQQMEEEIISINNISKAPLQIQELTDKEKNELEAKLENEIIQLKRKLINEEQIKVQLAQAMYVKEDRINKLEINLDQDYIKQTSAFCNNNKIKQVLNQVNKFLKAKSDFLTLREETIKKLQKQYEIISNGIAIGIIEEVVSETKKFQQILVECNEVELFQMEEEYNFLMKIVKENKELEVSLKINDIFKLNSFDLNEYKIFKIATNSLEGTRTHLDSDMMAKDIKSLKKNLGGLKAVLRQQKKELMNLQ
jgi:serine/threonine protein kinase